MASGRNGVQLAPATDSADVAGSTPTDRLLSPNGADRPTDTIASIAAGLQSGAVPPGACAICLQQPVEDWAVCGYNMEHLFHASCITRALRIDHRCPICRLDLSRTGVETIDGTIAVIPSSMWSQTPEEQDNEEVVHHDLEPHTPLGVRDLDESGWSNIPSPEAAPPSISTLLRADETSCHIIHQ